MKACNLDDKSTYTASEGLVSMAKEKNAKCYVNVSYTDYGGTIFDKILISFFKEKHPDNIIIEKTSWNGENAFIFGDIVLKLIKETQSYLLGFEDLEDYFSYFEQKEYEKYINYLINNKIITEKERELAEEYLYQNARVETFGVDADESDLQKFIRKNN